ATFASPKKTARKSASKAPVRSIVGASVAIAARRMCSMLLGPSRATAARKLSVWSGETAKPFARRIRTKSRKGAHSRGGRASGMMQAPASSRRGEGGPKGRMRRCATRREQMQQSPPHRLACARHVSRPGRRGRKSHRSCQRLLEDARQFGFHETEIFLVLQKHADRPAEGLGPGAAAL